MLQAASCAQLTGLCGGTRSKWRESNVRFQPSIIRKSAWGGMMGEAASISGVVRMQS
jgi:hypothetical protein